MVLATREELIDRLAALHRSGLELVSDLSLDTVLERTVQIARELASSRCAAVCLVDENGELDRFIPFEIVGEEIQPVRQKTDPSLGGKEVHGTMFRERRTTHVSDLSVDKIDLGSLLGIDTCQGDENIGAPSGHPENHSFLGVPILVGDHLLGQIYMVGKLGDHDFNEEDEQVIEILSSYAAVAITNARLHDQLIERDEELSKRNEDLKLLQDAAASLTNSLDVEQLLDKTLELGFSYLGIEAGEIFLREEGEKELHLALHRGDFGEAFSFLDRFHLGEGFIGMVAKTGKTMVSTNLSQDMHYLRPAVLDAGFQCIACIPLLAGSKVVGVMSAATRRNHCFTERELDFLNTIGVWAGLNIDNARQNRQSRRLAVLEERERIGMDLHDGIIQSIYGVGLVLDYARMSLGEDPDLSRQKIEESIDALNETIRDIRAYILDLRPRQFHGEDLKQGLQRLVDEFQANCTARGILVGPDDGLVDFPAQNATALFHICQEALANVARHARANMAEVHLWMVKDRVLLEISDDGEGFDPRKMSATLGHGLSNMHARARKVGGDVEITSAPGKGTAVLAWVPRRQP
jgi:two-component system sensor histidine kinase DevS